MGKDEWMLLLSTLQLPWPCLGAGRASAQRGAPAPTPPIREMDTNKNNPGSFVTALKRPIWDIAVASRHGVLPGDFMLVFLPRIQSVSPGEFLSKLRTADGRSLSVAE